MPNYKPVSERTPDTQYRDILKHIYDNGEYGTTRQGPRAKTIIGVQAHYQIANGFPMIPDRDLSKFYAKPIDELAAFINGVRTREGLEEYGVTWWDAWTTPEKSQKRGLEPGDIGPGSYGAAFHDFPTADGGAFDQFKHLVEQMKELPELRTHFVTPWVPQYIVRGEGKQQKVTLAPCHGWVHVRIYNNAIHLHMFQRSADWPVGVPSNMVQYGALGLVLEHLTGYEFKEFVHTASDAHIYEDQMEKLPPLFDREPKPFPTMQLNAEGKKIKDIHEFRSHHFELTDYDPHPSIGRLPVAT
nr:Thymidylate synthase [uncultured bacterium]